MARTPSYSEVFMVVEQRKLGSQGLVVSAQGLGAMGMTAFYRSGDFPESAKLETFSKALELGINFIDTAWVYQNAETGETNEGLIGKAIKQHGRDKFVIATKFGITYSAAGRGISGKPEDVRKQCNESLERLGTDYIDLYYMHRMDPKTPIEETMKCLLELRAEGKIKYVGLSECTPSELERAHAVFPITAIQMEWSLQTRDLESTVVPVARRLGVGIVAYSPLGRGFLSRTFTKKEDLDPKDWRNSQPRFDDENFQQNAQAAEALEAIARRKGITAAQLALAWVHSRGDDVFPIPGTKSAERLEENAAASSIALTEAECAEIEAAVPVASGGRYNADMMPSTFLGRL